SNDRFRFLVVQGADAAKEYAADAEDAGEAPAAGKPNPKAEAAPPVLDKEAAELLHAAIDTAHDFVGGRDAAVPAPFACVKVPDVPDFATDHVDKPEQAQLAAEFIDWLLTGSRDGALLRRKALAVE